MVSTYAKMKKDELLALARQAGIAGCGRMNKSQLIEALEELGRAVEPPVTDFPGSPVHVQDPGPPPPARPDTPDLPGHLGEDRLCFMPQGPRTAFAYWELGRGGVPGELVLKVRSMPGGEVLYLHRAWGPIGSAYVNLERAGLEIEGSLGVEGEGGFTELLRSNRIHLPCDGPSDEVDTLWMTRRRDFEEIFRLSGGGGLWPFEGLAGPYGERRPGVPVSSWPTGTEKGRR
ncbi:MAG: Rho termination factor N-terminal domain-containing protein [bacterium]|nr:Rho termination factor N-terminal domain-containing protein [bacterium]